MQILSAEFRTWFFSWILGDKGPSLSILEERERESIEILASSSEFYKDINIGTTYFPHKIFSVVVLWFVLTHPLKYVIC